MLKRVIAFFLVVIVVFGVFPRLISWADYLKKEPAYQFVVDGEVWFTVADDKALQEMIDEYQRQFLANVDPDAIVKRISFVQDVQVVPVEVRKDQFDPLEYAREKIYAVENEAVEITIKRGDNFWNLARTYNMTVADLEILNPDVDPHRIYPGDKLVISPFNPVLDVLIELENTVVETIPFAIQYQKNNNMFTHEKQIIRPGTEGEKEVVYHITLRNGYQDTLEAINETVLKEPTNAIVRVGTRTTVARGGRVNFGVVQGKRISSGYGWRIHPITGQRRFHDGLDIAANHGNPVYAYTDGRVVEAGWNGGYGNCVLIDHGNGLKTRYAHLSRIDVRVGQKVKVGQRIGAVGSTGNSTGPHLHFEVIKNGKTQNPLNYL